MIKFYRRDRRFKKNDELFSLFHISIFMREPKVTLRKETNLKGIVKLTGIFVCKVGYS